MTIKKMNKLVVIQVFSKALFRCLVLVVAAGVFVSANAAEVPGFDKRVSIAAREQPVREFFAELFGRLDLPVNVDPSVVGSVNGDFQGTARDIYKDVEKAFQLVMYFDRSTVYIYASSQLSRKIIPMSEQVGKKVLYNAKKMRIGDAMNKLEWSDMGLVVSGTDRYRNQVESYAQAIRNRTVTPQVARVTEVIKVFKLKYAWADDTTIVSGGQELLVRGVASLLRTVVESGMVGVEATDAVTRSSLPRTEQGLRGQGLQSVGRSKSVASTNAQPALTGAPAANSLGGAHSMSNTRIVADPLNNAVIIRDRSDRMQNYQDLINSLDIEPQMVEIEATIIDMDTDRLRTLGIDWRYNNDGTSILFGSAEATAGLLNLNPAAVAEGLNGFTQNVLNNKSKFLTHIKALETQGAARIVSKPHVMTLANVEALLDTTSTFFIRVAGREEVDLFNVSVGTTMRVTPHVFNQGDRSQIKLKIDIIDGSQSQQTVDDIPVIEESTINTQAIINAGQSLLIGGLVRELNTSSISKIPLLGDIPGIGALFRSNRKISSRMERLFLITPRLSTQIAPGKRYSVPILAGTEEQILEAAPARMAPAQAGLAARDIAFPIKQPLVAGNANADLTVVGQPLPDAWLYSGGDKPDNSIATPSIRDRVKSQNPKLPADALPLKPEEPAAGNTLVVDAQQKADSIEAPWQEVSASGAPSSSGTIKLAEKIKNADTLPTQSIVTFEPLQLKPARPAWSELPNNQKSVKKKSAMTVRTVTAKPVDIDGWTEIVQ